MPGFWFRSEAWPVRDLLCETPLSVLVTGGRSATFHQTLFERTRLPPADPRGWLVASPVTLFRVQFYPPPPRPCSASPNGLFKNCNYCKTSRKSRRSPAGPLLSPRAGRCWPLRTTRRVTFETQTRGGSHCPRASPWPKSPRCVSRAELLFLRPGVRGHVPFLWGVSCVCERGAWQNSPEQRSGGGGGGGTARRAPITPAGSRLSAGSGLGAPVLCCLRAETGNEVGAEAGGGDGFKNTRNTEGTQVTGAEEEGRRR